MKHIQIKENDNFKNLVAIKENTQKVIRIPNHVLRKTVKQEVIEKLDGNSICVVCDHQFLRPDTVWHKNIKAICHPFRDEYLERLKANTDTKLHTFSESDFVDKSWIPTGNTDQKKYDFVCFTLSDRQGIKCKGFYLAPVMVQVAKVLQIRGLVIDYHPHSVYKAWYKDSPKGTVGWQSRVTREKMGMKRRDRWSDVKVSRQVKMINHPVSPVEVSKFVQNSRFVIFPNTKDASPRMITESLIQGVPVLLNRHIYGGWKYINEKNGMYFDGAKSYEEFCCNKRYFGKVMRIAMRSMLDREFNGSEIIKDYYENYGFLKAAKRLAKIVNKVERRYLYDYVVYEEFADLLSSMLGYKKVI
tara:strand:- start:914 stop:1987 length:1074 start_codon:yes stop_codon:yes gene_type:complete